MATKPMLTLDCTLDGYTLALVFTASKVGATTVTTTAFPASTTKRNNQSRTATDGVIKAVLDALNAAETAAGTDGVWTAPTIFFDPCKISFKRTADDPADRISTINISSGLASILGLDPATTPTHNGSGDYTVPTRALGRVWSCPRYPESDLLRPRYSGAYAQTPYGDQCLIVEAAVQDRDVLLRQVPGWAVLADTITRAGTYAMASGMTINDTNAALDSFWASMLGGGSIAPNPLLRYYPDREDTTAYQRVQLRRIEDILDPVSSGAWVQTTPTPNLWTIRLSLTDRRE